MQRLKLIQTATMASILVAAAMALDYLVNAVLKLGVYTPVSTLLISVFVTVPSCYYLIGQRLDLQAARDALAETLRARDAAEADSAAKSAFLGAMSHELRTPLNAIIGYTEMMLENAEEERREGDVADHGRVLNASQGLLRLITDVLEFSSLEAGGAGLARTAFEAADIVHAAAAHAAPQARAAGNRLSVQLAEGLGFGLGDAPKIRKCLDVLLSNAAKFTQSGEICVTARREQIDGEDWFVFDVADTGVGMNEEAQARLFKPFTQADARLTRAHDGAGLGLALAARLTALMGGSLSVASTLGAGATFTLRVPAVLQADAVVARAA